ncbi:MAG TPA: hypothetical protein VFA10_21385, partial [Ktedonobacteraceae bacterium]|nr:hypothetical protein [Ktedonobacteraceae bacterium]
RCTPRNAGQSQISIRDNQVSGKIRQRRKALASKIPRWTKGPWTAMIGSIKRDSPQEEIWKPLLSSE